MRISLPLAGFVAFAVLAAPDVARAQASPADRALATELFEQARVLVADGKAAEACPKFAESQRLDPGLGTLLNLANCHELEGRIATAWSEYHEALAIAERERQPDRVAFAETHIQSLAAQLPRLTLVVPRDLDGVDVAVTRDGSSIARVALGTAMPVDPGRHRIAVDARGYLPWSADVEIAAGERRELAIGPLVLAPEPVVPSPARLDVSPSPEPPPAHETPTRRRVGLVLGGAGLVALTVGSVAGVVAISSSAKSDARCSPRCSEDGYAFNQDAKSAADVATVSFAIGAVALGIGVVLYLTGRPGDRVPASAALAGALPALRF